jgi:hypothetical protein
MNSSISIWSTKSIALAALCAAMSNTPAHAQSLSFQATVLTNDKLQKDYRPYKLAIASALGSDFLTSHPPTVERRRVCKWDGEWQECGYMAFGGEPLNSKEVELVTRVLMDPCKHLDPSALASVYRFSGSETEQQKKGATKYQHLLQLCAKGFVAAVATRAAPPPRESNRSDRKFSTAIEVLLRR